MPHLSWRRERKLAHFAAVIGAIRARCPQTTIEVLTPDFLGKNGAVETVVAAKPDVFDRYADKNGEHD